MFPQVSLDLFFIPVPFINFALGKSQALISARSFAEQSLLKQFKIINSFIHSHSFKSVQIRRFFWSTFSRSRTEYSPHPGKYGPEKTPYLDTFYAVLFIHSVTNKIVSCQIFSCGNPNQNIFVPSTLHKYEFQNACNQLSSKTFWC